MIHLLSAVIAASAPVVLHNHLGYDVAGPKRAIVQGARGDKVLSCALEEPAGRLVASPIVLKDVGAVPGWRDWTYATVDFSALRREGEFRLTCATSAGRVQSFPFRVQKDILERHTLSDVLFYFKGQRASGAEDQADRALPIAGKPGETVDAHGGWYDATGDYGKHLSHLSFSTYFNPQQTPMTVWALVDTYERLEARGDQNFRQYRRRLADESAWGADFLVRMRAPGGSFYRSVSAPGSEKAPADRVIARDHKAFALTASAEKRNEWPSVPVEGPAAYQTSFRSGGGVAVAALARAAAAKGLPGERKGDYLKTAEEAWAYLAKNNLSLTNDGKENILDDYCALFGATELYRTTKKPEYKTAMDDRAQRVIARLAPSPRAYWRADDGERPFFHAVEAGLPVVALLRHVDVADPQAKIAALDAVRRSLEWELTVTSEVANPFGYARQLVQTRSGARDTRFFYPHDTDSAPWWQGENARLASLAAAARLAIPHFASDTVFAGRLRTYALDQLNWILGANPFDASMMRGTGRNSPEYLFFDTWQYTPAPGGICNGITGGFKDDKGIDFHLPKSVTGGDNDWRWQEQWLPHNTWYLLAVAAGG